MAQRPVFDATQLRKAADLTAAWLIHAEDTPARSSAWAQPDFDDSHWLPVDPNGSIHSLFPNGNPGVVWYRLHIKVASDQTGLALMENNLSSAFVVYSNGVDLIHVGRFSPFIPYVTQERRVIARIPDSQIATGSVVLALRVHISEDEWTDTQPGLAPGNLFLGLDESLREERFFMIASFWGESYLDFAVTLALSLAALFLYSSQRHRIEYLWLALFGMSYSIPLCLFLSMKPYPQIRYVTWPLLLLGSATLWFMTKMYFALIHRKMGLALNVFLLVACSLRVIADIRRQNRHPPSHLFLAPEDFLLLVVLPTALFLEWRRGNREAGVLLIPLLIADLDTLNEAVYSLNDVLLDHASAVRIFLHLLGTKAGPFLVQTAVMAHIASSLSLALIILMRANRLSRQGAVIESELAAAREIQQIILPQQIDVIPGFAVETAYIPAQQVGGDFFQVLPLPDDSLLVIVGDVAGKGLPAAMLVSVLVGATRTAVAFTSAPEDLLAQLNARLVGRTNGGFSTAIAAHISSSGLVSLANAGHLSPYLDGRELELPGALPLGLLAAAVYETTNFQIAPGSRLTFYSDGVVEAQSGKGELLGFDRAREISTRPATAIAEAACAFGQSDDITVVAIIRLASSGA